MQVLTFYKWLNENSRPMKQLSDLDINRRYKGTRYEYELFPRFRRLQSRISQLDKKPNLHDWFIMMQNSDAEFYTLVQTGALGQPDVRELWRDLTGQKSARMRKYNMAESITGWVSSLDKSWKVFVIPTDWVYPEVREHFGETNIAIGDLLNKTILIDGEVINRDSLTEDHILAIEAHEIAHSILHESLVNDELLEKEADWLGIRLLAAKDKLNAAKLLENRFFDTYGHHSDDTPETNNLFDLLKNFLKI